MSEQELQTAPVVAATYPAIVIIPGRGFVSVEDDIEHVRTRPGMYVGGCNVRGLHHLIWELVDNSLREIEAGYGKSIRVTIHADESCTVADDGRGIPVGRGSTGSASAVERVFTSLGAKDNIHGDPAPVYGIGAGIHAIGAAVVNFMSEWLEVQVSRGGLVHRVRFERGVGKVPLAVAGRIDEAGTSIRFRPDSSLFKELRFDREILTHRLRELAALHAGVAIELADERVHTRDVYFSPAGLVDHVRHLSRDFYPMTDIIRFSAADPATHFRIDGALRFVDNGNRILLSYVNDFPSRLGGVHVDGLRNGTVRALNDSVREGGGRIASLAVKMCDTDLVAVVSVRIAEPQYAGSTKDELMNDEVEDFVADAVSKALSGYFRSDPDRANELLAQLETSTFR